MATKKQATPQSSAKDLHSKLAELRKDLRDAKRSNAANELPNPRVIGNTKRDIARTLTAINATNREKEADNA